jgi:hypothetical protein
VADGAFGPDAADQGAVRGDPDAVVDGEADGAAGLAGAQFAAEPVGGRVFQDVQDSELSVLELLPFLYEILQEVEGGLGVIRSVRWITRGHCGRPGHAHPHVPTASSRRVLTPSFLRRLVS